MMNIDESNQIVYDAIYKNITKNTGKTIKIFDEFGYFKYAIFPEITDSSSKINLIIFTFLLIKALSVLDSKAMILQRFMNTQERNVSQLILEVKN